MLTFLGPVKKRTVYQRWYDALPELARSRPVSLREEDRKKQPRPSWYDYPTATVVLVRGWGDDQAHLLHELGHHLHLRVLTEQQREAWAKFWEAHRSDMPSAYARGSAVEGFPEACSYAWRGLKVRPAVREWLRGQGVLG